MRILIKGAGDLASGIACRLHPCGFEIIMTETQIPTTVRRMVSFSRAVYEDGAEVEGIKAVLAKAGDDIDQIWKQGQIPVMIDPCLHNPQEYQPDVVVDAILAKKNLGTQITDAGLVIGVGPGFTAETDCHCVIETMRGHDLGKVIRTGSAIANTGIPGEIGGYTVERLIRASACGQFEPVAMIGEVVEKGQLVAKSGGKPVYALMSGIVRGMLQASVVVTEGMKCGDIDARCNLSHCFTVSDKARAIGGGVLEAIGVYTGFGSQK